MDIPSYDPTDQGNEPGNGPLRVGGQTTSLANASGENKDLPSTRSKAAKRQVLATTRARDLWAGQDAMHAKTTAYLPKHPAEDAADYGNRLRRSVFHNYYRRAIEGMVGLVYRVDPKLGEDVPSQIVSMWEDIDLAGTHGDVFCRDISTDAMVVGHAAILVEFPATGGTQTTADEMRDTRPYFVPILKENILSWRSSVDAGATVLDQVVLYEEHVVPDGLFGEKEQKRYRVLRRENGVVRFDVLEITEDKRVVEVPDESGEYRNQTQIPLAEVPTSGRRGLFDSAPPLNDVAPLNVAYYQKYSDLTEAEHKTVPFLFTAGIPSTDENGDPINAVAVGPNTWLNSSDSSAKAEYVAHRGEAIKDQKATLDELKGDIASLSLAMLSPQKRQAETATAKRLDKAQSDSALAVTARAWQDAFERALGFMANYLNLDAGGSIEVNRDFEGLVMEAEVMRAYAELVKAGFPARLALDMLQRGGRIAEDVDLDELEMEIMANEAARAEQQAMEEAERLAEIEDAA